MFMETHFAWYCIVGIRCIFCNVMSHFFRFYVYVFAALGFGANAATHPFLSFPRCIGCDWAKTEIENFSRFLFLWFPQFLRRCLPGVLEARFHILFLALKVDMVSCRLLGQVILF